MIHKLMHFNKKKLLFRVMIGHCQVTYGLEAPMFKNFRSKSQTGKYPQYEGVRMKLKLVEA